MRRRRTSIPARTAFTLVELLVVVAIMGLLMAAALPALQGTGARRYSQTVGAVAGAFEQARAYAVAQNTYTWVALYTNAPGAHAPADLYVGVYASNDGTDPLGWADGTYPLPYTNNGTIIFPVVRLQVYHAVGLAPLDRTYPTPAPNPSAELPAAAAPAPVLQLPVRNGEAPLTLSSGALIQFLPSGGALSGTASNGEIGVGLQGLKGTEPDANSVATLCVSGLTGLTKVYRK